MSQMKMSIISLCLLIMASSAGFGQSSEGEKPCNHFRLGFKTLIPNLAGGTAEIVLPVANKRLSFVADYTRFGMPKFVAEAADFQGSIKATLSYLAVGPNFYLNSRGRGGGAYFGMRFQQIAAKTVIEGDESFSGEAKQKALAFLFGISTAGHFWTGLEIGAGKPLGPATGSSVEVVDGKKVRTNYSESIIPVIPIFNFKIGVAF